MENGSSILLLIAAAFVFLIALVVVGLIVWFATQRSKNSQNLRNKFGPEYDNVLEKTGDKHSAERTLTDREKRVTKLDIRDLSNTARERYHGEWIVIQAEFVNDPSKSVKEANRLITEVMVARGFPVADFEQRTADLSVLYPDFVTNYRSAQAIALKNQGSGASTEELRQAMVYYHSLFEELLGTVEPSPVEPKQEVIVK